MWIAVGVVGVIFLSYLVLAHQFAFQLDKWILIPIIAGTFLALGLLSFTYGMSMGHTGSIAVSRQPTQLFTAILAFVFLNEELNIMQISGIGAILFGIFLLVASQ